MTFQISGQSVVYIKFDYIYKKLVTFLYKLLYYEKYI